ncbi:MAG: DUF86 domain-containing protein [Rhodoferax sp.]
MSDASTPREWRFYVQDMLGFCQRVEAYRRGLDQSALVRDPMRLDAIVRNLELIGEAATHVPEHVRQTFSQIPWRRVVATRNRLVHGYLGIDNDTLWSIVTVDVPSLMVALRTLLMETDDGGS